MLLQGMKESASLRPDIRVNISYDCECKVIEKK